MATTVQPITAEELLRMPDDGSRCELVRGELRRMSPAGQEHGRIAALLTASLVQHVTARRLGAVYAAETGFQIGRNPDHVRAPDAAFVRQERLVEVGEAQGYFPGAPDLAVEVVSPGDTYAAIEDKVLDWLQAGCPMVVVVNPRRAAVTVYRSRDDARILTAGDVLDGGDILPGWRLPVADLFG